MVVNDGKMSECQQTLSNGSFRSFVDYVAYRFHSENHPRQFGPAKFLIVEIMFFILLLGNLLSLVTFRRFHRKQKPIYDHQIAMTLCDVMSCSFGLLYFASYDFLRLHKAPINCCSLMFRIGIRALSVSTFTFNLSGKLIQIFACLDRVLGIRDPIEFRTMDREARIKRNLVTTIAIALPVAALSRFDTFSPISTNQQPLKNASSSQQQEQHRFVSTSVPLSAWSESDNQICRVKDTPLFVSALLLVNFIVDARLSYLTVKLCREYVRYARNQIRSISTSAARQPRPASLPSNATSAARNEGRGRRQQSGHQPCSERTLCLLMINEGTINYLTSVGLLVSFMVPRQEGSPTKSIVDIIVYCLIFCKYGCSFLCLPILSRTFRQEFRNIFRCQKIGGDVGDSGVLFNRESSKPILIVSRM